jgi:hypothetical protein
VWFVFRKLRAAWERMSLNAPLSRIISEASIGKVFLRALRITPFLEQQGLRKRRLTFDVSAHEPSEVAEDPGWEGDNLDSIAGPRPFAPLPDEANAAVQTYRHELLELCGVAMESMNGARSCVNWRHDIVCVILADFKSQYPTINYLLGLHEILIAERIEIRTGGGSADAEDRTARELREMTLDTILTADRGMRAKREFLRSYVLIDQTETISVVRTTYKKLNLFGATRKRASTMAQLAKALSGEPESEEDKARFQDASSTNIGVNFVRHGPRIWIAGPTYLALKFLNGGHGPRIIATKTIIPIGEQKDMEALNFFGREDYAIDPREDIFKRVIDMRSEVKADLKKLKTIIEQPIGPEADKALDRIRDKDVKDAVAAARAAHATARSEDDENAALAPLHAEVDRLDGMQLALKLIANSTSYGVKVEFIVDERKEFKAMTVYCGETPHRIPARARLTDEETGERTVSPFKVERPGAWFDPSGPLITSGGLLFLSIAESLARRQGLTFAMCDTDSMAFALPRGDKTPWAEFVAKVKTIAGPDGAFEPLNPYEAIDGKRDPLFNVEDANFEFENIDGKVKIRPAMKPLYMLPVSSKRYACANIVRADGGDYSSREEMLADAKAAKVILRKVSSHGLGAIAALDYGNDDELAPAEAEEEDEEDIETQAALAAALRSSRSVGHSAPHEAVPYRIVAKGKRKGEHVYQWGDICKGKGNPRLYCDMWRMVFCQFLLGGDRPLSAVFAGVRKALRGFKGLDDTHYQQRPLNTRNAMMLYGDVPHARPFGFLNVLPRPIIYNHLEGRGLSAADELRIADVCDTSLYMEGGKQDVEAILDEAERVYNEGGEPKGLYRRDNGAFPLPLVQFRDIVAIPTLYNALCGYFEHDELKSRGDRYELRPRSLVIMDKQYIGKETTPLDEASISEADVELHIEDRPAVAVLRNGVDPFMAKIAKRWPDKIAEACGVTPRGLDRALRGDRRDKSRKAMGRFRNVFVFDEDGELMGLDLSPHAIGPRLDRDRMSTMLNCS